MTDSNIPRGMYHRMRNRPTQYPAAHEYTPGSILSAAITGNTNPLVGLLEFIEELDKYEERKEARRDAIKDTKAFRNAVESLTRLWETGQIGREKYLSLLSKLTEDTRITMDAELSPETEDIVPSNIIEGLARLFG